MRRPDSAAGPAAAEIVVDLDRLVRLAGVLRGLAGEMSDRNGSLQDQLSDPELHEAMRHAERDWWNQRRRLKSYLDATAEAIAAAVQAYRQVEHGIANAAAPDQGGGPARAAF
jgi:hypothetical protein